MDEFDSALAALWAADDTADAGIDWNAVGIPAPRGLDPYTREALYLIEPPPPPLWRRSAHAYQIEAADAPEAYVLMMAGRGAGKTHTASNVLAEWIDQEPGDYAIVAPTFGDALKICVDGPSGFLRMAGDAVDHMNRVEYVIYMRNGSRVVLASADAPDRVRGWNLTGFWADELASWRRDEVWYEGLEFATRIGRTRRIITTTPKRGSKVLKELLKRHGDGDPDIRIIRASTRDNAANLSETFLRTIERRYIGTTLGRQELDGEMLADVEGALVTTTLMESTRVRASDVPDFWRIVVGVDPAVTNTKRSDEVGIIVAAIGPAPRGWQPPAGRLVLAGASHIYFLEDYSGRMSVDTWARRALQAADEWGADAIIAEKNQGGDLVESNIRNAAKADGTSIPHIITVTASRGKRTRAEPVGGLFEQHRAHVLGSMPELEENWTSWIPGEDRDSPDRLDGSVWAAVGLMPELGVNPLTEVRVLTAG
jgi:phage terminase large subunit-like protein